MAKLQLIATKDIKVGAFSPPIAFKSLAEAERAWTHEINSVDKSLAYRHPEDIEMYHLGSYDEDTGISELHSSPLKMYTASQLKKKAQ